ncbi:DNA-binding protein [Lysobacter capsici]|uniref:DNA-binding protein n=1 Tax=Lysobacter capsici TaxID=435897 RepID=UPI00071673A3|nr:DNA-binding protein [Lysobacter capsici]
MARGISESDVHNAADALVVVGERPTVERIRAHLGTGSPNTVTRWLETWWQGLGERLQAQERRLAVRDAPEVITVLAGEWWAAALEHAQAGALEALSADRAAFQAEQDAARRDHDEFAIEVVALRDKVAAATHAELLASAQATELQRLVKQLEGQFQEASRQRDTALAQAADVDAVRKAADARLQELQESSMIERENLRQHIRMVEDRAHAEVDRARQETKELHARVTAMAKEHAAVEKALLQTAEHAKATAAEAGRSAGIERARADALETQLAKLQDLPAALEAVMRRSDIQPKQQKPSGNRTARGSRKHIKSSVES